MDKNTLIGFLLIGALIFGFMFLNKPTEEELRQQKLEQAKLAAEQQAEIIAEQFAETHQDKAVEAVNATDSVVLDQFGVFAPSAQGEDKLYTIENNLVRLKISLKGGQIVSAELKDFKTYNGQPLFLFDAKKDSSFYGFTINTANDRIVNTRDLYFEPLGFDSLSMVTSGEKAFVFRLKTVGDAYLDFVYTLAADDYMTGFSLKPNKLETVMPYGVNSLEMQWNSKIHQQEKSSKFESRYANLYYKHSGDDVDYLAAEKNDETDISTKVKWIAFKDQFFSTILVADEDFLSTKLVSTLAKLQTGYLKNYAASLSIPFDPTGEKATGFRFYFGPNKYHTLHDYDKDNEQKLQLEKLVPLGPWIIGWINRWVVIPVFDWLSASISNFGIIILILTLLIKIVLFPLTYKSYLSGAKMRVLKPQIDEINSKIPATKPQERQQATMALYRKVGVNPLGGCLPLLLQMPILFAMFSFFPAAIELRQQSFLWASDLSSYDAILTWNANIPFITKYFGNHLSLFCLLMSITNLVYTHINMGQQMEGSQQIPGMKYIMYLMPIIFLFMFNDYASGLSYYYFIATLITILQTVIIRAFVDEEKLLKKLHAHAKNPKKQKKSGLMSRLEEAQRRQLEMQKQRAKGRK
ncbi:MAG: membrane protein insertase YidC [Prevotellaceae bacterium]|jgi:YidC/Oxa1 family membrane protein insertase|nr:membrane protein insertase YidC [Prevotellaceae bacterium]